MKAFIVAALLVASVASQSFDLKDLTKDRSIFRPNHKLSTIEELLLKEKLGNQQMMGYKNFDMDRVYGGQQFNVLSLSELVSHPIFREYMQIPLFVQFAKEYPVSFRRYVESPVFQSMFTVPKFQMYFSNVYFFNKYIVPQVQMISQTMYPTTEEIYNYGRTTPRYTPYTPEVYQTLFTPEMYSNSFNSKKVVVPEMLETIFGDRKVVPDVMTPEIFEPVFGKVYSPEVYGTSEQTTDIYNNEIFSMKNKMMMNPIVSRMLKNKNKFNQFNKMDLATLKTIQAEKMIEEIQKEKIKDTVIPKMMETEKYQHIPLTYVKPNFGSTLDQFTTEEKEIKNLF